MGKVIPFKVANPRHGTEVEFSDDRGRIKVTADMSHNGFHEIGLAFWMDEEMENGLFDWLLKRRRERS